MAKLRQVIHVFILLTLAVPSSLAEDNETNTKERLLIIEQKLFGRSFEKDLISKRLIRCESTAFGKVQNGPPAERVESLLVECKKFPLVEKKSLRSSSKSAVQNIETSKIGDRTKPPEGELYLTALHRQVRRVWLPPKGFENKKVTVLFRLHRDGAVSNLVVLKSSGEGDADKAALSAIQNAAPFKPLPDNAPENIEIVLTFDDNL